MNILQIHLNWKNASEHSHGILKIIDIFIQGYGGLITNNHLWKTKQHIRSFFKLINKNGLVKDWSLWKIKHHKRINNNIPKIIYNIK